MNIIDRAAKAFSSGAKGMTAANALAASSIYRGGFGIRDYSEPINAQNAYMAVSSIFGCLTAYAMNAPQVKMQVQHLDGEPWLDHPAQWLIQHPNDDMSERTLSLYNCIYKLLGGASYQHLLRSDTSRRQVIGWRPYNTNEMSPVALSDKPLGRNSWIDCYYHTPISGAPERVDRQDIAVLRFPSINPIVPQAHLSPLAAMFLDVSQDKAVTQMPTDLMNNSAFMSTVFTLGKGSEDMPDAAFKVIKSGIEQGWTSKNRFKPMVSKFGGSVEMVFPDFRKMDWSKLGERPELRICAALRVPVRYMGFSAGIDASTSDNYIGSWISFVKDAIIGQALLDADALTSVLTREYWGDHPTVAYGMDRRATSLFKIVPGISDVQALQAEKLLRDAAARENYKSGALTKDEFRADIGKAPVTDGTGEEYSGGAASASANFGSKVTTVTDEPDSSM